MWLADPEANLFLIITNSTLKPDNTFVMGQGIGKQAHTKLSVNRSPKPATAMGHMVRYRFISGTFSPVI